MIVDTSAIVAIIKGEATATAIAEVLAASAGSQMSAPTRVELALVVGTMMSTDELDHLLTQYGIEVVSFSPTQARLADEAHRRFGRGNHPARLNLGDTYTYALARDAGQPVLCSGNDFAQTDVLLALPACEPT